MRCLRASRRIRFEAVATTESKIVLAFFLLLIGYVTVSPLCLGDESVMPVIDLLQRLLLPWTVLAAMAGMLTGLPFLAGDTPWSPGGVVWLAGCVLATFLAAALISGFARHVRSFLPESRGRFLVPALLLVWLLGMAAVSVAGAG